MSKATPWISASSEKIWASLCWRELETITEFLGPIFSRYLPNKPAMRMMSLWCFEAVCLVRSQSIQVPEMKSGSSKTFFSVSMISSVEVDSLSAILKTPSSFEHNSGINNTSKLMACLCQIVNSHYR